MKPVNIRWLSIACFEIEQDGRFIVTDPCITDNEISPMTADDVQGCDIITLTHSHWDHITDIPALMDKFSPQLLCGTLTALPLSRWADCNPMHICPMDAGLELDFGYVKVKALFGTHTLLKGRYSDLEKRSATLQALMEKYKGIEKLSEYGHIEYRNYLLTYPDGKKILIWGNDLYDTQFNMLLGLNPDIAILQYKQREPERFVKFAKTIGAKTVIPHHMDLAAPREVWLPRFEQTIAEFEKNAPDIRFLIPDYGKTITL